MKQITLRTYSASAPCLCRLAFCWAVYGYAMALLWRAFPHSPLADAVIWLIALCCGLALATTEV